MTITITLELGPGAREAIERLRVQRTVLLDGLFDGARRGAARVQRAFSRNLAGVEVGVRSGTLLRSARVQTRRDDAGLPIVSVGYAKGLADPYAAVIELGTVGKGGQLPDIVPREAKALAVPLSAARDARGIPIFDGPRDPAIAGDLFFINRGDQGKPPLLARKVGDTPGGDEIEALFVLLRKVAVAPRAPARKAIEAERQAFGAELIKGVERAQRAKGAKEGPAS